MQKTIILVIIITCFSSNAYSQSTDSIEMVKVFGGYQFYQKDQRINMRQLVKTMEPNEQAYKYIKSAQTNSTIATLIGAVGGALIGWPVGTAIGGGDPNWTLAAVGAGLVVVTIPIASKANKQSKLAVEEFNEGLKKVSFKNKTQLHLSFTGNKIGLKLSL